MAAAIPAVTLDTFLKQKKERHELREKLNLITLLKAEKDKAERQLKELIPDVASVLIGYGQKKVELDGFTHLVYEGTNVSISGTNLKSVLMRKGIDPDTIVEILNEATVQTPYTTITTKPIREEAAAGGITGK